MQDIVVLKLTHLPTSVQYQRQYYLVSFLFSFVTLKKLLYKTKVKLTNNPQVILPITDIKLFDMLDKNIKQRNVADISQKSGKANRMGLILVGKC